MSILLLTICLTMASVTVKQMHKRAGEDEDEWCVSEYVLPVPNECADHNDGKGVIEPVGNAEVFHEWGWE